MAHTPVEDGFLEVPGSNLVGRDDASVLQLYAEFQLVVGADIGDAAVVELQSAVLRRPGGVPVNTEGLGVLRVCAARLAA